MVFLHIYAELVLMGDEKDTWKVKTLDEILQEKKRRREQEEKTDPKRPKATDERDSKRDTLEEGELQDHKMEITIRNSPYVREESTEDRGEEDDSLAIKPPQQILRKEKSHHRKEDRRKEKKRHRSNSTDGAVKHARPKDKEKEKERENERRKRQREEQDKARREWERQKRREQARMNSRRERDRLEQLERQRERERKLREQQQKEQREQVERERRAEERRKEREARREAASHHRGPKDEYGEKGKQSHRSRSPSRQHRERQDLGEGGRMAVREEKQEDRDLLSDLQDVSESERKTSTAESSTGNPTGLHFIYMDRLEQLERQKERERKLREQQQKEQREQVERERRAEERRKEREARREAASHHRGPKDEYGEKGKQSHRSRSPSRQHRERQDLGEGGRMAVREEKQEDRDLLSDLQDVSESERKTSTAESSTGSGTGSEEEEDTSSESEGEGEGGESATNSEDGSEQTADEVSEVEQTEEEYEEERENGIHIPVVTESRFDHDTEESLEEEEEEEEEDEEEEEAEPSLHSRSNTPEGNYIPESPPMSPVELKKELPKYLPALQGCRSVEEFQCLNRIEEGTYGVVYRAKDKKTDEIVALKRLKMEKEKEGFPITSLREINTILKAQHPNIVTVREIVVGSNMDKIYIVMNYVEHDLKSKETWKIIGPLHLLEIGDFGLAREYGSPLKPYTPVVVTLWYRAPELLLGAKVCHIHMCTTLHFFKNYILMLGKQSLVLSRFLTYCPSKRITAEEALKHEYFRESPLPIEPAMFPTWPAKSEQQRVKRGTSPRPPEGGLGYSQLGDDDLKDTGFHLTTTNQGASAAGPGFSLKF
ncbi:UNVERIFIED_CONTAM: hypothetical protein FKN15_040205 [Acipenser sinensis]